MLIASHLSGFGAGSGRLIVVIATNQQDYNLFTALGSPTSAVDVEVFIASGVNITASSTSTPAFDTGPLPAGSKLKLIIAGRIQGAGGPGGRGRTSSTAQPGQPGFDGGNALNLMLDAVIDNGNGQIWAGGGGGGGGGKGQSCNWGGGGGGGAGQIAGSGGLAGSGTGTPVAPSGTSEAGGAGGSGCDGISPGGSGGGPGQAGSAGAVGTGQNGAGGAAGKAIALNGHAITWLGGSSWPNVKGAVA